MQQGKSISCAYFTVDLLSIYEFMVILYFSLEKRTKEHIAQNIFDRFIDGKLPFS